METWRLRLIVIISLALVALCIPLAIVAEAIVRRKRPTPQPTPAPKPPKPPEPIEWRTTDIYEDRDKGLRYPVKLCFAFQNIALEEVFLADLGWESTSSGVQLALHPDDGIGFRFDDFNGNESRQLMVAGSGVFKIWIGINENHPSAFLHAKREERQMGTLVLSGHVVGGPKFEQRFQV